MTTLSERILGLKKSQDGGYQAPVWNAALEAAAAIVGDNEIVIDALNSCVTKRSMNMTYQEFDSDKVEAAKQALIGGAKA